MISILMKISENIYLLFQTIQQEMVTHLVSTGGVKQVPAENPRRCKRDFSLVGHQIEVPFSSMNYGLEQKHQILKTTSKENVVMFESHLLYLNYLALSGLIY